MDEYKGKLNIETAKIIIADHYDVYLQKENMCSRTVCSHYEKDAREYMSAPGRPVPYAPHGAVDGFVCDTNFAKKITPPPGILSVSCKTFIFLSLVVWLRTFKLLDINLYFSNSK
jgi:hypothetical protein